MHRPHHRGLEGNNKIAAISQKFV